ncbi:MAG: hypothetical protein AAGF61_00030 [Pseudomonadota bacterium]
MKTRHTRKGAAAGFAILVCGSFAYWFYSADATPSVDPGSTSRSVQPVAADAEEATLQSMPDDDALGSVRFPDPSQQDPDTDAGADDAADTLSEAELYAGMTIAELPEHIRERGYENLRKQGYFYPHDWKKNGYLSYDQETIIALARSGDAVAEHMIFAISDEYPMEVRQEVALSSALRGRTAGLYMLGSEPFFIVEHGRSLGTNEPQPTVDNLIEGYGQMMVAVRMGDSSSSYSTEYVPLAQKILSEDEIAKAERFADDLYRVIKRDAIAPPPR